MSQSEPNLIGDRYELGELLGRGGMAEVRSARDLRLGRTVAIKRLRTDLASDATFQARFRREAQSSASLNHPAIVSVYDTGEEMAKDGSGVAQPYIVMELVNGRTLRDVVREGRRILPERALEITSGVLSALDYSHRAGIIHRDIKPGNVMLTPSGDVKVMDFGIARAISDASSTMTQTAAVVGTAQYLSPEQARGETVDSRSDVYSTGCLLYELLTGRPPFVGDSPVAVAYQHVRENPVPPSDLDDQLDPEIDRIVLKSLAKRVEDRYQSAAAMRADIERYLAGHPVEAAPVAAYPATEVVPAVGATTTMPSSAATTTQPPAEDEKPRKPIGWLVAVGALVLALVALAVLVLPQLFPDAPDTVQVPNLVGKTEQEARALIGDKELTVGRITEEASDSVEAGLVIRHDPNRDLFVEKGTAVDLVLSAGKPEIEVPYVIGIDRADARDQLEEDGFRVKEVEEESDEPAGQVLRTNPTPGTAVPKGSRVTIFYSAGPNEVPDVIGKTQAEAERILRDAGFVPQVREDPTSTEPKGQVVDQLPGAGETRSKGDTIIIFVSVYEEPTETETTDPTDETDTDGDGTPDDEDADPEDPNVQLLPFSRRE
ncbi:MAG: Stk1 family PASTA domain-containing Ser/Thr kinase [Nocardioides sp.]|uniref:Stk1 family PASTA domain-containing Ser/Thr kinase n=1 Tax=Nocardioides sp. TaxID=35761 RepID=UPI003F0256B6